MRSAITTPAPPTRRPWLLAAAGAAAALVVAALVVTGVSQPFDAAIGDAVRSPELAGLLAPLRGVTELGSTWVVTGVAVLLLVGGSLAGRPRDAFLGALCIGLGAAAVEIVKLIVARARPELLESILVESGYAFPSGHTTDATIAYGIVAVVVGRTSLARPARVAIQVLLVVVIGLVGLSRVWLGVHHPTDVLAGWAAGAAAVSVYVALTRRGSPAPTEEAAPVDRAAPRSDPPAAA